MVKRTEIHIPVRDITKLSFSCEDCHAVITVDIAEKGQREGIPEKINEKFCPVCNRRFMRSVSEALMALMAFCEKATAVEVKKNDFHLVISESTDEAE
jgi:hypothetical protein